AWAKTLEEMLRTKLPERAQAIRIVMLELTRIAEHLTVMQEMIYSMRKDEHRLLIDCLEKGCELFEKYCGHRQGMGVICLGGVRQQLPHGWVVEFQAVSEALRAARGVVPKAMIGPHDFRAFLSSAGVSAQMGLQWGVGGPTMR